MLHNARRSYELRDLFLRLQNNRSLLAREVHFLSSAVYDGDIHGLTEIKGFLETAYEKTDVSKSNSPTSSEDKC